MATVAPSTSDTQLLGLPADPSAPIILAAAPASATFTAAPGAPLAAAGSAASAAPTGDIDVGGGAFTATSGPLQEAVIAAAPVRPPEPSPPPGTIAPLNEAALPTIFQAKGLAAVDLLCAHTPMFFDGTDFGVARPIYEAYVKNQDKSVFFAAGTNDARDVEDIVKMPWYRKDKVQWYGWEASESVHALAVARFTNNPEVQVAHRAIDDKDGVIVNVQGGDGTLGIGHGGDKKEEGTTLWEGSSRQATTMRFDTFVKEKSIKEISYLLLDVEGHEEPAIKGMALETNALSFPVFQWELGPTWADGRNDGKMTQGDMVRYLESLGYVHFLMGAELTKEEPILVRTDAAFFEKAKCVTEGGPKPFVPGNLLAVQQSLLTQNTKPWLTDAIAKMVQRGNNMMPSGCSPIKPSLIIVLVAVLQAFI